MAGDDLMDHMKAVLDNMSDAEKAHRAQSLKQLMDGEMKRRAKAKRKQMGFMARLKDFFFGS